MKRKVYVETSVISYLTARPSKTIIGAAHQQITLAWWELRSDYELLVSPSGLARVRRWRSRGCAEKACGTCGDARPRGNARHDSPGRIAYRASHHSRQRVKGVRVITNFGQFFRSTAATRIFLKPKEHRKCL